MDSVSAGLIGPKMLVHWDDGIIFADSLEKHRCRFNNLADRLRQDNLKMQLSKCIFLKRSVNYFGHVISNYCVSPDEKKIEVVKSFSKPISAKKIKQFLGLAGYYRRFIKSFAKLARLLAKLLTKEAEFESTAEQHKAFDDLKERFCNSPILQYLQFNWSFILTTEASNYATGAVLLYKIKGHDLPVAYASGLWIKRKQSFLQQKKKLHLI